MVAVPAPMLAVAGRPPDDADWAIEMKWDGVRAIVVCRGGECRLDSRNQRDITGSYPELAVELGALAAGRELTLDGEIIAQTATGAPSFALLQRRMHVVRPTTQLIAAVPVQLHLFDNLTDGADSLTALPYLQRRERLQELEFTEPPVRTRRTGSISPPTSSSPWLARTISKASCPNASTLNRTTGTLCRVGDSSDKRHDSAFPSSHGTPTSIRTLTLRLAGGWHEAAVLRPPGMDRSRWASGRNLPWKCRW
ncbi:hypothetical protein FEK35_19660 [Nocardia cyriacigeorgica]|uniref:ATP-dependent DNA ligase family profile domain-containing protein n=1 Tax=Nocardia cyriacigeorgica TaxID=135487 RepID=A0A5R8PAL8_9NOCA|nr:hypothetical protein FEK35_19660 [Nocardia cyriacigeorgica]